MTIDEIYKIVQVFANKEQRGFISPGDFNLLAKKAQMELIEERLKVIEGKIPWRQRGFGRLDMSADRAKQDLAPILAKSSALSNTDNVFTVPADSLYLLEVLHNDTTPVDIVDDNTINYLLRSTTVSPSTNNPVALLYGSSVEVFPSDITTGIKVKYYKKPADPKWAYVNIGASSNPIHNPDSSVEFALGTSCHNEIIIKILSYVGVNLRDADIVAYSKGKEQEQNITPQN